MTNQHKIYSKIALKYTLMRVRAKISFMALEKRKTVCELFVTTILAAYNHLMSIGRIKPMTADQ